MKTRDDRERQIQESNFLQIYFNISEKAQKSTSKGHWNLIRSHNIRKFFNTTLKSAGCDSFHVEYWMGHQLDTSQMPYFLGNPEQEKEIYSRYVPYLTIEKAVDVSENPEYIKLRNNYKILEAENAQNVIERFELQDLRKKVEKVEEFEKMFETEINRLRDNYENPKTDGDKELIEHRRRMAFDADYRKQYEESNISLKPKKRVKEITNEDFRDAGYWDYEGKNS